MKFTIPHNIVKETIGSVSITHAEAKFADNSDLKISTNSLEINSDEWFLALIGEKHDAHKFLDSLADKVAGVIVQADRIDENDFKQKFKNYLIVDNTLTFFQECAANYIEGWKDKGGTVISMTGSNGKTTCKEYLASILMEIYPEKVYATEGNYNNHIGVPYTCFQVKDDHKYAVIEMGTSGHGEIKRLCEIARPDAGFITNIGLAHIEILKSREGVFNEKRALYDWIVENSRRDNFKFLINSEDMYLDKLERSEAVLDITEAIEATSDQVKLKVENEKISILSPKVFGKINFFNLGLVSLFLKHFTGEEMYKIVNAAYNLTPPQNNRSTWIEWKEKSVYLDAYNANPSSMKASLDAFFEFVNSKYIPLEKVCLIIGDMNELGESAEEHHREIARFASKGNRADKVKCLFVGNNTTFYSSGCDSDFTSFKNVDELKPNLEGELLGAQYVFVKGSRSVQLEKLFQ